MVEPLGRHVALILDHRAVRSADVGESRGCVRRLYALLLGFGDLRLGSAKRAAGSAAARPCVAVDPHGGVAVTSVERQQLGPDLLIVLLRGALIGHVPAEM